MLFPTPRKRGAAGPAPRSGPPARRARRPPHYGRLAALVTACKPPRVHSTDDEAWSAYLDLTRQRADQLLRADDPYDIALQLWGDSLAVVAAGEYAGSMSALWGALTDWVETKPDEEAGAKAEMIRAAQEWLALDPHDGDAVCRYFDHWLHDVCGYKRP
jgi:hypothetical protein